MAEGFESTTTQLPSVYQWEEARASLDAAISKCLDIGISLEQDPAVHHAPERLGELTNSALEFFNMTFDPKLVQTRSVLARTRNRIFSPIFRLSEDLLSEIFMLVVFAPVNQLNFDLPVERNVTSIYRALYNLLAVCSLWKNCILARGLFWSVVPLFQPLGTSTQWKQAMELGIKRAGTTNLHLAVSLSGVVSAQNLEFLAQYVSRFCTLNLRAESAATISSVIEILFASNWIESQTLSQLSIRVECGDSSAWRHISWPSYAFPANSPAQRAFEALVLRLSVLRIRNIDIHWNNIAFSQRLTELHLEGILYYDSTLFHLLEALSTTKLRSLKLISITPVPEDSPEVLDRSINPTISLPSLQTLFLHDLYFSTLKFVLSSITSRSHKLSLSLTPKFRLCDDIEDGIFEALRLPFEQIPVAVCLIDGSEHGHWLSPIDLKITVQCMSALETLKFNAWKIDQNYCRALTQYHELQTTSHTHVFPSIMNISFTRTLIEDEEAFKDMVSSHSESLRRMRLGGYVCDTFDPSIIDFPTLNPLKAGTPLTDWISTRLQCFELVDQVYTPPEFKHHSWQLW